MRAGPSESSKLRAPARAWSPNGRGGASPQSSTRRRPPFSTFWKPDFGANMNLRGGAGRRERTAFTTSGRDSSPSWKVLRAPSPVWKKASMAPMRGIHLSSQSGTGRLARCRAPASVCSWIRDERMCAGLRVTWPPSGRICAVHSDSRRSSASPRPEPARRQRALATSTTAPSQRDFGSCAAPTVSWT